MAKKAKGHPARRPAPAAAGGRARWLRVVALAVLTIHSAFSAYLSRDDERLVALVAVGYLLMLWLLLCGLPPVLPMGD